MSLDINCPVRFGVDVAWRQIMAYARACAEFLGMGMGMGMSARKRMN